MPQVKIIQIAEAKFYDDYDYRYDPDLLASITDWEEVTPQQLSEISYYLPRISIKHKKHYVLLIKEENSVPPILHSVKEIIAEMKKEEEAAKKREATRKATLEAKRKEKELKKLAELQAKYGEHD